MSNLVRVEHRRPGADIHVYLATPAHTLHNNYVLALMRSIPLLLAEGISVTYALLTGHPHVDDARNLLVADFLKTQCTDLFFIDADVAWQPSAIERLLRHGVGVVAGAYPLKDGSKKFPIRRAIHDTGSGHFADLYECDGVPTGFLCIQRQVIQRLADKSEWVSSDGERMPVIFERRVIDGERVGGDFWFCVRAREFGAVGGAKVYCDPHILFTHQGLVDFPGRLADHLGEAK